MEQIEVYPPEGWEEITVGKFQEIQNMDETLYKSKVDYLVDAISIICDIDKELLVEADYDELNEIAEELLWIQKAPKGKNKETIEFNGKKYKFIEKYNSMKVGEMISLEQIIDMEELTVEGAFDVALAILLREVKEDGTLEKFNASKFIERREYFSGLPITDVVDSLLFFSTGDSNSIKGMKDYSKKKFKIVKKKKQKKKR